MLDSHLTPPARGHQPSRRVARGRLLILGAILGWASVASAAGGNLTIKVIDPDTGEPMACRMHLQNAKGKPQRAGRAPFWHDHFVFPGTVKLKLPRGEYTFVIERGPEYLDCTGQFSMSIGAEDEHVVELHRAVDMADEGWWSADLHIHRPLKEIELLMQAEDLHIGPVITWWNDKSEWSGGRKPPASLVKQFDKNRYYHMLAGEDERQGGALLYFNLREPLKLAGAGREFPSPLSFAEQAREQGQVWIDAEKPFWWDLPVWLAAGQVNSIGLCNNHMGRSKSLEDEAWGRPRDKKRLPPPLGNGRWSQEIYYHVLNCGLRIPPSAGSASGVLTNPVGYNRMYAWVDKAQFNYENWWEAFQSGRVMVTNGPLIRPLADGRWPGHVFRAAEGEELTLDVVLNMSTRDPVSYLELIKDGRVAHSVRYEDIAKTGHFPPLTFDESGWFLVRAVTDVDSTYRFASTGPWYVEVGDAPRRVSKSSAQFFLDWVKERMGLVEVADPNERQQVLRFHEQAEQFWSDLVGQATAD